MMDFFDKIIGQVFANKRKHPHLPLIEEPLERNEAYRQRYFRWLNQGEQQQLAVTVWVAWQQKKLKETSVLAVHLLQQNGSNGLAVTYHPSIGPDAFQHFFDWLKDRMLQLGYRHYTSDRRIFDRNSYVETIEKHYLKPPAWSDATGIPPTQLCNQQYGNVLIEYIMIDQQPSFIRFMAHYYDDHLYTKALAFDDLVREVLT
jgi:hypothetical protein